MAAKYLTMVRQLQWLVTLGRFDIHAQVTTMSRFRAAPRQGHMDRLKRIYSYAIRIKDYAIRFRTDQPDYSFLPDQDFDWAYSVYGNVQEILPDGMPDPNRSLLSSGGLMADVPCLDHSLDGCKGRHDDVQTTKHARRTHAWSRCTRTSLGAHASLFGASGARFWIVTRATSARIEEPSMVSILYIKSSIPDTYK